MPRALTEQEKCTQCQRLLNKGKDAVFLHGLRKVSVDDITRAAGIAKGSFYQHFDSKDQYLCSLIVQVHHDTIDEARQLILAHLSSGVGLHKSARAFLKELYSLPSLMFFIRSEHEITALLETNISEDLPLFKAMEAKLFEELLQLVGVDTKEVCPGVIHNYIHLLFLVKGSSLMNADALPKTIELLEESLIAYLFGESQ